MSLWQVAVGRLDDDEQSEKSEKFHGRFGWQIIARFE